MITVNEWRCNEFVKLHINLMYNYVFQGYNDVHYIKLRDTSTYKCNT